MDQKSSWPRRRIGLILTSSSRMVEPEFHRHLPDDVHAVATRLRMTGPYHLRMDSLLPKVAEAAMMLADAKCDVVIFHCTATSMEEGQAGDVRIQGAIEQATGLPALSTGSAILAALRALDARRLSLLSPYDDGLTDPEADYLRAAGHELGRVRALHLPSDVYSSMPPDYWVEIGTEAQTWDAAAEALVLSCTNIRCLSAIRAIERKAGRPVVTSNQAAMWQALRLCGDDSPRPELGQLFERP